MLNINTSGASEEDINRVNRLAEGYEAAGYNAQNLANQENGFKEATLTAG
jgi:hypothetical protein